MEEEEFTFNSDDLELADLEEEMLLENGIDLESLPTEDIDSHDAELEALEAEMMRNTNNGPRPHKRVPSNRSSLAPPSIISPRRGKECKNNSSFEHLTSWLCICLTYLMGVLRFLDHRRNSCYKIFVENFCVSHFFWFVPQLMARINRIL